MAPRPGEPPGGSLPASLPDVIIALRRLHGRPEPIPTSDPFELVLWENVVYLGTPEQRREAFARLRRTVGTRPESILAAKPGALEAVTRRGILGAGSADKLRASAAIAIVDLGGRIDAIVRGPLPAAVRALRRFPSIGEPGAEKILLFAGAAPVLAPESNGLRVLTRLGLVREQASYARTYAAAREAARALPARPAALQEAHLLLAVHGRTVCKRAVPSCEACPLVAVCAYARAAGRTAAAASKRPKAVRGEARSKTRT